MKINNILNNVSLRDIITQLSEGYLITRIDEINNIIITSDKYEKILIKVFESELNIDHVKSIKDYHDIHGDKIAELELINYNYQVFSKYNPFKDNGVMEDMMNGKDLLQPEVIENNTSDVYLINSPLIEMVVIDPVMFSLTEACWSLSEIVSDDFEPLKISELTDLEIN